MSKDRLIVAMDVPNVIAGLELAKTLGDSVSFYKIGLGMLTGGGLALANELKQDHGKRIFLDMKFFDIGATVEAAVRGMAQFETFFSWSSKSESGQSERLRSVFRVFCVF